MQHLKSPNRFQGIVPVSLYCNLVICWSVTPVWISFWSAKMFGCDGNLNRQLILTFLCISSLWWVKPAHPWNILQNGRDMNERMGRTCSSLNFYWEYYINLIYAHNGWHFELPVNLLDSEIPLVWFVSTPVTTGPSIH